MVSGFVQVKQVIFSGKRHENILLLETLICRDNLKKVTRRLEFRATGKKKKDEKYIFNCNTFKTLLF